jgi:hypothetical protein
MIASTQLPLHGLLQTFFRQWRRTELVGSPLQLVAETLTLVNAQSELSVFGNGGNLKEQQGRWQL